MKKETYKDYLKVGRKISYWDTERYEQPEPDIITDIEVRDWLTDEVIPPEKWDDLSQATICTKTGYYWVDDLSYFSPVYSIKDCDEDDLKKVFSEIAPGSMYLCDYGNSLGVDKKEVYEYVEGYENDLVETVREEFPKITDDELCEKVNDLENAQGFADYVQFMVSDYYLNN